MDFFARLKSSYDFGVSCSRRFSSLSTSSWMRVRSIWTGAVVAMLASLLLRDDLLDEFLPVSRAGYHPFGRACEAGAGGECEGAGPATRLRVRPPAGAPRP